MCSSDLDAVNQAIGQGEVQVTPLQVADFVAAIANGGTLYRPQLIEKIQPVAGDPVAIFKPEARGTLPLNEANLLALQEAMIMVTQNSRGTANFNMRGIQFKVAGKTGTAESNKESGIPHAWITAFAPFNNPEIAVTVMVEEAGQGSDVAGPIAREVLKSYFMRTE